MSFTAVSLVAAIPAGFLAYLLVMAILQDPGFDKLAGFLQIVVVLSLLAGACVALMPIGILLFFNHSPATQTVVSGAQPSRRGRDEDSLETAAIDQNELDDALETFDDDEGFGSSVVEEEFEPDQDDFGDEGFGSSIVDEGFDRSELDEEFDGGDSVVAEDEFETLDDSMEGDLFDDDDDGFDDFDFDDDDDKK
ncbi:hypothetical protein [Thalassoroseus pseudoceratinae]|uniref:hypothetical protein n=1 Tax=Thalassoroseus pseudoceratinae TaxID=2713176 RepID=UPI001423275B|nr:hypothetical protein [Thalassoroseus pseudoceratinae]